MKRKARVKRVRKEVVTRKLNPTPLSSEVGLEFKTLGEMIECMKTLQERQQKYHLAGGTALVVDAETIQELANQGFEFNQLKVVHILDLPPEKQRRIREGLPREEVLKRMRQRVREGFGSRLTFKPG